MASSKYTTRSAEKKTRARPKSGEGRTKPAKRSSAVKAAPRKRTASKPGTPALKLVPKGMEGDPAMIEMSARMNTCNKPPIKWRQQTDGSWEEGFLKSDCTYGNWVAVDESQVPPDVRNWSAPER